jgi:hypothetical protein
MDLPVSNGKDSVLIFVDRMTKMSHFIPCSNTTDALEFARLFVANIVRLHDLPASIVSDRGSIFTSHFWSTLASILKIDPRNSTAFNPQTDGLTERMNQALEAYLRISFSYNQDDWFDWLPLAEFAYNNSHRESTKMTPFSLITVTIPASSRSSKSPLTTLLLLPKNSLPTSMTSTNVLSKTSRPPKIHRPAIMTPNMNVSNSSLVIWFG